MVNPRDIAVKAEEEEVIVVCFLLYTFIYLFLLRDKENGQEWTELAE